MARMTPYGSLYIIALVSGFEVVGKSPFILETRPATSTSISIVRLILKAAQPASEPVSSTIYFVSSSARLLKISAVLRKMSRFAEGGRSRHAGKAAWAAVTAERASATVADAERWTSVFVEGELTSKVEERGSSAPLI